MVSKRTKYRILSLRRILCRASRLSLADWALLVLALFVVIAVRLGLYLLPFRTLRSIIAHIPALFHRFNDKNDKDYKNYPNKVAWAIRNAARLVPGATCLTQALSVLVLCAHHGLQPQVRIGAKTGAGKRFEAHAWVEYEGRVILGHLPNLKEYSRFEGFSFAEHGSEKVEALSC